MDPLIHDPKAKNQIKNSVYEYLYEPAMRQLKTLLDSLIVKNALASKSSELHFLYKNELYSCDGATIPLKKQKLLPAFHQEMDQYLAEIDSINKDELPYVMGFLRQVLNASNSISDYLSVLPDAIHHPIEQLKATCPCQQGKLTTKAISALKLKNQKSIELMKQRLAINLLI
jgi:predicted transcriptional regulator